MITGIILGVIITSAFWIWMITIMLKRTKLKTECWSEKANELLERKCDALEELCEIIRLKGKGMPRFRGYGKGDLLVRVGITVPKRLAAK